MTSWGIERRGRPWLHLTKSADADRQRQQGGEGEKRVDQGHSLSG